MRRQRSLRSKVIIHPKMVSSCSKFLGHTGNLLTYRAEVQNKKRQICTKLVLPIKKIQAQPIAKINPILREKLSMPRHQEASKLRKLIAAKKTQTIPKEAHTQQRRKKQLKEDRLLFSHQSNYSSPFLASNFSTSSCRYNLNSKLICTSHKENQSQPRIKRSQPGEKVAINRTINFCQTRKAMKCLTYFKQQILTARFQPM